MPLSLNPNGYLLDWESDRGGMTVNSLRESVGRMVDTLENTNQRLGEVIDYLR